MKNKLKLFSLAVLGCMFMVPSLANAEAAKTPVYDDVNKIFFANGTPITIVEEANETWITWDGGREVVTSDVTVYGGGDAGTSFDSSSVTMHSGKLASIYGGGKGSTTKSADVETATIVINGGALVSVKNGKSIIGGSIYGGGSLAAKTANVTITIKGGTVPYITGGGRATVGSNSVGDKTEPEKSPNATNKVTINISAGTINDVNTEYGIVYGGGQGYSYVKDTNINISGTPDLSQAWVVGSGSNGRTDYATINVAGGTINTLHTINRGSMIDANVSVTGGKITNFFVGGEDPETFDNDIVNGGFLGNIMVDITGGTITKLTPGSDYDKTIAADADYVMVFYKESSVTNAKDLATSLGASAKPYVEANGKDMVIDDATADVTLEENLFEALAGTNSAYSVTIDKTTHSYTWTFDGSTITDSTITVDTEIELAEEAPDAIKDELEEKVTELKNVMYLNFSHHGALPGKATITYDVSSKYEDGTKVYVRHYNETTKKLEDAVEVTVEDGNITFDITSCSSYVLSTTAPATNIAVPSTGDNILYIVGLLAISIFGITLTSKKLLKA